MDKSNSGHEKALLVIVSGLLVIHFAFRQRYPALIIGATAIGCISVFMPALGAMIVKYWLKLAMVLGKVNGSILLTLIFCCVLAPIAFFAKMTRKDPLLLKSRQSRTTFHDRFHTFAAKDMENTW